jgi:uncharacterized protein with PIN domain
MIAIDAFRNFGKGRHPAGLNIIIRTDVRSAIPG